MCADDALGASGVDRAVAVNHVVITDVGESPLEVPLADLVHGVVMPLASGGAVHYDFGDVAGALSEAERSQGSRAGDAVDGERVLRLEVLHGLFGKWAEDAVGKE